MKVSEFFKNLFHRGHTEKRARESVEELRATFRARYHHFKLLLNANNKALEVMADMEHALEGIRVFGMSFVRASCTGVSVNVFQMIKHLDELAPGKYTGLYPRFRDIQSEINRLLSTRPPAKSDRLILRFREITKDMADQVGSKMANVGEVRNPVGLPVPDGFVLTSLAYRKFMEYNDLQAEIDRLRQASEVEGIDQLFALSADIQQLIIRSSVPGELKEAIMEGFRELEAVHGKGVRVSMRSSALGEDVAGTSFAGQYRSELNVSVENIIHAYKEIVASKYGLTGMTYRLNRGIRDEDVAMCVGCMVMVPAVSGGVMYSSNPVDIRDTDVYINSVWGLPKSVVDGSVAADLFVVSRGNPMTIVDREVGCKDRQFVCYPDEGVCRLDLTGERSNSPSLTDEQVLDLAEMAVKLEDHYGSPQDIEWAIDARGSVYVLQCRPLQQVQGRSGRRAAPERASEKGPTLLEGGVTASPGVASGPVFHVRKNIDTLKFPEGAVLVASQALPAWAALLNRAAAVVTEQGSVAGHLANVAREFGVPAIFGVPRAMEKLKTGEVVTVDGDGHTVYQGRVESLLEKSEGGRKNLMEGSPVHETLKEVMEQIVPLNLLEPESPAFRPRNCKTLHDITRFCHEKSVHEMFSFGKKHHFSERSSKQLVCHVPMQWWIINLDDGFRDDVEGKFVHIDNIVSIPMLALWEGITAVPWEGPPPVDTKGFMSVLLQATTNPELDPSTRSSYANRNYFMISRTFCSLHSRFGFHFSTVEALVGERPSENYVSFQFKGGAADYPRRLRRALFVGGILEEFDFRAEVKEDAVFARVEGLMEQSMREKLRVLGYLIIHTRQLDMIMSRDGSANTYRAKFMKDLESIRDVPHALESA